MPLEERIYSCEKGYQLLGAQAVRIWYIVCKTH